MSAPSPASKVANTQTLTTPPIPRLMVAPFPAKLQKIDPDGVAKHREDQQRIFDEWWKQLNTVLFQTNNQVQILVRK